MIEEYRPNPDKLLREVERKETSLLRGHLRIFFGMCAGVGKTYAMLQAAQEARRAGVNIAVGIVETHGRMETAALLEGLRVIPKLKTEYKGATFEEMDIDRILKERPELVLVDELAHTNAPGSRHVKRYEDVKELLDSGIHIFTTMNVQHVESRADLIEKIAKIPIRETVPDSILEMAEQIELVDLPPPELMKRLRQGKVYLGEAAERAIQNFFKEETLTALRELSLRFTAEQVDHDLEQQRRLRSIMGPLHTKEKLLVAISHSPYSSRLIRSTKRMAASLNVPWLALYVEHGEILNTEDREMLAKNLELAKELGAEIMTTHESDLPRALKRVAEEHNVTQIIMGRPDRRFFRDTIARGTTLDRLVRETSEIDVHVIRQERKPKYRGFHLPLPRLESGFIPYWYNLWFIGAVSVASYAVVPFIGYRAVGFIFLMAVLLVSIVSLVGPILFSAALSALVWNYFFIPPRFTFTIGESADVMMVFSYIFTAIVAGFLTTQIRRQEKDLRQRENRANTLYELGRDFAEAKGEAGIASVATLCIQKLFSAEAHVLNPNREKALRMQSTDTYHRFIAEKDYAVADWSFRNRKKAGWGTETLSSSPCLCIPLLGKSGAVGVLLFYPEEKKILTLDQENLLETICYNLAVALERETFEFQARQAKLLEESERLHQTIINSVSHELRTPLTSIIGSSTALQDPKTSEDAHIRKDLLGELIASSERLNRVVENLLDMSRLNSGVLKLKSEIFDLNDLARSTCEKLSRSLRDHTIRYDFSPCEIYCTGDCRLLEHAIANLLMNAVTYSPKGSTIEIATRVTGANGALLVKDEGPGIPAESLGQIFEKFYRVPGVSPGGAGLGLSIVKGIVDAHRGRVRVESRLDRKGSIFILELLLLSQVPSEISKALP